MKISETVQFDVLLYSLRRKGLDAVLSGRPLEGEGYYRTALEEDLSDPERVRFLVCLADALIDEGLYDEAEQHLAHSLDLGDATGSAQGSMADVLLLKRSDPERALQLAEQSYVLGESRGVAGEALEHLRGARLWARKAEALLQLDRRPEAEEALENAISMTVEAHACDRDPDEAGADLSELVALRPIRRLESLAMAATHWRIGTALAALGARDRAAEHFRIAWNADRKGKYKRLAEKALNGIGAPVARAAAARENL
jgi:tetratricopeptide (TPR) repeat protein